MSWPIPTPRERMFQIVIKADFMSLVDRAFISLHLMIGSTWTLWLPSWAYVNL